MEENRSVFSRVRMTKNYITSRIERLVLYQQKRWIAFGVLLIILFSRSFITNGYYALLYLYCFFILQRLILFVTPSGIPSISEEEENDEIVYEIPEHNRVEISEDESKPVIRRMGEFKLW